MKRYYKCAGCGAIVDHFIYRYDSAPNGDDEDFCPECGSDYGFEEVKQDLWEITKRTKDTAGLLFDIKCTNCGHHETVRKYPWPSRCYVCAEE